MEYVGKPYLYKGEVYRSVHRGEVGNIVRKQERKRCLKIRGLQISQILSYPIVLLLSVGLVCLL